MGKKYDNYCLHCDKRYRGESQRFCSHSCSMKYIKSHNKLWSIEKVCKHCNQNYTAYKNSRNTFFCGRKCAALFRTKAKRAYPELRGNSTPEKKYYSIRTRAESMNFDYCTKSDFLNWFESQDKKCVYCDIPTEVWERLYSGHHNKYSLTVDRKDNGVGYLPHNMALACSQCNTSKSNILTHSEMTEIGQKYLKPKWQNLIADNAPLTKERLP